MCFFLHKIIFTPNLANINFLGGGGRDFVRKYIPKNTKILFKVPSGRWHCFNCTACISCGATTPFEDGKVKTAWVNFLNSLQSFLSEERNFMFRKVNLRFCIFEVLEKTFILISVCLFSLSESYYFPTRIENNYDPQKSEWKKLIFEMFSW